MDSFSYWHKQSPDTPLFADIAWSKPERLAAAGKLAIIGGNAHGFSAVAASYSQSLALAVGQVRVVLPDVLKKSLPTSAIDAVFVPTNHSGSIAKDAASQLQAALEWADMTLLIGDMGKNSETAIAMENLLKASGHVTITRDAVDLVKNATASVLERPNTLLVVSFAQAQKLLRAVYYPKTLLFNMQLSSLVDALHKFTITYPVHIVTFHNEQLIAASGGQVSTTPWQLPMALWSGSVATRASIYIMWHPAKALQAITTSFVV